MMSELKKNGFVFTWRIDNFSFCHHSTLISPYFTDDNLCPAPWKLHLQVDLGNPLNDEILCGLYKYDDKANVVIDFEIEAIGPGGHVLGTYGEKNKTFDGRKRRSVGSLVKRSQLEKENFEMKKDTLTVRCHMCAANYSVERALDCVARTKIIVNQQSLQLLWTEAEELKTLFEAHMEEKNIARAFIDFPDSTAYEIVFNKIHDDIKISITGVSRCYWPQSVECNINFFDVKGCIIFSISDKLLFLKEYDSFTLPTFLTVTKLKSNQSKWFKNGSLVISCELFSSGGIKSQVVSYQSSVRRLLADHSGDAGHTLRGDFRKLFSDKTHCDVQLRADNEIVQAHKSVLAARSPVFNAMFHQDMLEAQTGVVEIKDVDIDTLKALLDFMYSDVVGTMDYESAKNLLIVGDKYGVLGLKELCISFLKSEISEENACEIATLANALSQADLKSLALDFIVDHSVAIVSMPEWMEWVKNNTELATVVFQRLSQ